MLPPFLKIYPPLLMAFYFALPPLLAAPKEDSLPPPSPSVGKLVASPRVVRGGVCEVIVRGIVMPRDSAKFKVHKGPKYGSLDGPVLTGSDTAIYTYRHNGKKGTGPDRIDFRIKTGPNKTWGPVTATITIEEPPSRVELIDSQLDFGSVPIGQSRSTSLRVRNGGGGILRGTLEIGDPWSIDGSPEFELAEGVDRNFLVVFSPDGPGERQGRLDVLAGNESQLVTLRGEGAYRFDTPERIAFQPLPIGKSLELPLTNLTNRELPLSLVIPPPLIGDSQTILPGKGTVALKLQVEKRHYTEKFAEVSIADGLAIRKVRVALPPPPALLEWASEGQVVDLGEMTPRNIPRPEFELRNRGATAATVQLRQAGGGLSLAQDQPEEFPLQPGESAVIKTVWRLSENPGEVSASLVASHGGLDHVLKVKALVAVPSVVEESAAPSSGEAAPEPAPDPRRILSEAEELEMRLRRPFDIETGNHRGFIEVGWKYSGPEPVLFWLEKKVVERAGTGLEQIFERRLQVPQELPQTAILEKWVPVAAAEARIRRMEDGSWIGRVPGELPQPETLVKWVPVPVGEALVRRLEDGTWQGSIPGLEPGYQDVRIATRTPPDGPRIDYSEFVVRVYPPPPNPLWKWITGSIGIFCLLYLLRKKIRRLLGQKPDQE